jgi:hypothetical protein
VPIQEVAVLVLDDGQVHAFILAQAVLDDVLSLLRKGRHYLVRAIGQLFDNLVVHLFLCPFVKKQLTKLIRVNRVNHFSP